ncbi:VRR-NUC domain-containing protein [Flectobacillus longus]|uniref:VRR-NUC domain-containing protein n=1 Tax=Flectobacillus longus TaxID=2984207 RepID=UPI0024B675D1|nr:VRR-NUC domain-containing protein [Flectobacillus longus]MDI9878789.1 VRR-NUC domain-containing protein [Flectobacillus longus]
MIPIDKKELPPKYYLTYFQYLLDFIKQKYAPILNEQENAFIQAFEALSEDEQCLYIRFSNRRGSFFKTDKLKYAEIEDIDATLDALIAQNFLSALNHEHITWAGNVLDILNKPELIQLAKMLNLDVKGKNAFKKEELLDWLLESASFDEMVAWLNPEISEKPAIIKVNYEEEVQMLKFLFFGSRYGDMTEFVVRDLGFQTYEHYDMDQLVPHFQSRQEAEDKFKVSLAREDFYEMQEQNITPEEIYHWFMTWTEKHKESLAEIAQPSYARFALKVGSFFEKAKLPDLALPVFRLTHEPPSRERQVRILHKIKNLEEAQALCELILSEPQNADEQFFALDFFNKLEAQNAKKKVKKAVTDKLHEADVLALDKSWQRQVEFGVIAHYEKLNKKAAFTENHLWRSLFGLLFWDIIFDTESMAIHHPLQRSPSDLFKPTFFEKRKQKMEERLEILDDPDAWNVFLNQTFFEKYGITNPLVDWYGGLFPLVITLLERLSSEQVKAVMLEMARNLRENVRGFPDLFIWDDGDYQFIEVKSPTDSLSNQQLYWLRFFESINLRAKVLRIEWKKPDTELITA